MPHLLLTAAATLSLVVAFLKPYLWYLALGVVSLVLSHRSQIDEWAENNPRLAAVLKLVRALGLDPWMLVQAISLLVRKRLPAAQVAGSKSMRPPPLVTLTLGCVCLVLMTGCAELKPIARTTDDVARSLCALFFSQRQGVTLEQAERAFCATEADLRPWLDQVLAAKQAAAPAALALHPVKAK